VISTDIECRLRQAYRDAAELVQPHDISPVAPRRVQSLPGGVQRSRWFISVAAAAGVLLIAIITAVLVQSGPATRPPRPISPLPGGPPQFAVTAVVEHSLLTTLLSDVRTGKVVARVAIPAHGEAEAVAALSSRTFVLAVVGRDHSSCSGYGVAFYRLGINDRGHPDSLTKMAVPSVPGTVQAVSVAPDGTALAYAASLAQCAAAQHRAGTIAIVDARTGKTIALWPTVQPMTSTIRGLSLANRGSALDVNLDITFPDGASTRVLRPGSSGQSASSLGVVLQLAASSALSRDGRTLYAAAFVGKVHGRPRFDIAAYDVSTRARIAVLHTWPRDSTVIPRIILDPSGRYLLVLTGSQLAMLNLGTGKYSPLAGHLTTGEAIMSIAW
jgi:hypothetical protein